MAKNPNIPFSDAFAGIRWPAPQSNQGATIAFFYSNRESLERDYGLTVQRKLFPNVGASSNSLWFEQDHCGQSWFAFGRLHFMIEEAPGGSNEHRVTPIEPEEQRIAVLIDESDSDPDLVAQMTPTTPDMWVVFTTYDAEDPRGRIRALDGLRSDSVVAAPETKLVMLPGLYVLGEFILTKWDRY